MILLYFLFSILFKLYTPQVPLSNTYAPADGFSTVHHQTIGFPTSGFTQQYTALIPSDMNLQQNPYIFLGIYKIVWQSAPTIEIQLLQVSLTNFRFQITSQNLIKTLVITGFIIDKELSNIVSESYEITQSLTNIKTSIINHQKYQIVVLNHFVCSFVNPDSETYAPLLSVENYISRDSTEISLDINADMSISKLKFTMFNIEHIRVPVSKSIYGVALTIATNANGTIVWNQVNTYESNYYGEYFIAVQAIGNVFIKSGIEYTVSIEDRDLRQAQSYFSQIINLIRYCPQTHPYFNLSAILCLSTCGDSHFATEYEICQVCDPQCKQCSLIPSNCTICESTATKVQLNSLNIYHHTCSCLQGQFKQFDPILKCTNCAAYCKKCSTLDTCDECLGSFYYDQSVGLCKCRGRIIDFQGSPRCISKKIKQQCGDLLTHPDKNCCGSSSSNVGICH